MDRFTGKSIVVTGAASGIGRAAALAFAREGGRIVAVDRRAADAEKVVAAIAAEGGEATFVEGSIDSAATCERMVDRALEAYGRLDIAFNNAGIGHSGALVADTEEAELSDILNVNVKGVFLSMKYEIRAMLERGGGVIVNTASVAGLVGEYGIAAYAASKHGVVGFTKTAAVEYIGKGIRINAVCPGATLTDMLVTWFEDPAVKSHVLSRHPIGRAASAEEIAKVVLFLASDDASYVVGHALAVDGGLSAQ